MPTLAHAHDSDDTHPRRTSRAGTLLTRMCTQDAPPRVYAIGEGHHRSYLEPCRLLVHRETRADRLSLDQVCQRHGIRNVWPLHVSSSEWLS